MMAAAAIDIGTTTVTEAAAAAAATTTEAGTAATAEAGTATAAKAAASPSPATPPNTGDDDTRKEQDDTGSRPWRIYLAHTLGTWGDNMWYFAGGLYMMALDPASLRLTAIYGFTLSITVICFGATLGKWIDKTSRIKAARLCLLVQNVSVTVCVASLSFDLFNRGRWSSPVHEGEGEAEVKDYSSGTILTVLVVLAFSSVASLASMGTGIILQKDWIVVITGRDSDKLAKLNSTLRSIGLTTRMLAPVLVGQLFTFLGYVWTGVFIAVWNMVSLGFEMALLNWIYRKNPALAKKGNSVEKETQAKEEVAHLMSADPKNLNPADCLADKSADNTSAPVRQKNEEERGPMKMWKNTISGWKTYFTHPVRNAGLGLALLYLTVLGFDNITYGYVLTQGVPESVLGILVALSALVGIAGSTVYPIMRRRISVERTGLIGFMFLVLTSSLAVLSVFLPGSPFPHRISWNSTWLNDTNNATNPIDTVGENEPSQRLLYSASVLLVGITVARFGLWIADLSVNQILQERVIESQRGVLNGVQDSLNSTLDLMKCVLVILLPLPRQFGYLIFASFTSINMGWLLYALYSRKQRGHLFHFDRLATCLHAQGVPPLAPGSGGQPAEVSGHVGGSSTGAAATRTVEAVGAEAAEAEAVGAQNKAVKT